MKTALEWQSETGPGNTASVAWIKSIQADAYRAGQESTMKWVSEECKRYTARLTGGLNNTLSAEHFIQNYK